MLKKPPRVRINNGALQVRLRLDGRDHFINRIGRFDDPVAQARGQAMCAEIWRDAQQGDLDLSLNRYRPLVGGGLGTRTCWMPSGGHGIYRDISIGVPKEYNLLIFFRFGS